MSKINTSSLRFKIFIFYIISFSAVFGSLLAINFVIFDDYLENAEIKKAQMIAEMVSGNIAAPLQLGLKADVKNEILKQIEHNRKHFGDRGQGDRRARCNKDRVF